MFPETQQGRASDPEQAARPRHPLNEQPDLQPADRDQAPGPQTRRVVMPRRPATITYTLIAINVVIYGLGMVSPNMQAWLLANGWADPASILANGEFYRLFTAMFLHSPQNLMHILFNMYALYAIGQSVERVFGPARYLTIYFLGGLAGSVLSVALGDYDVPSIGASGAVFAVWAAEALYIYLHRHLMGGAARGFLINTGMLLLFNLAFGLSTPGIDNWGHIGGFLGGGLLAYLIAPRMVVRQVVTPDGELRMALQDVNPFAARINMVMLYSLALLAILFIAIFTIPPA